ncbi:unnamed protein product [Choristocarpus tenellus]
MVGFSDVAFANNMNLRSASGYMSPLGNAALFWKSKKLNIVATSYIEADVISLCAAAQESYYWRTFLHEIANSVNNSVTIVVDNRSAIQLANHGSYRARTKIICIRPAYMGDLDIDIQHVAGENQYTDSLTKHLPKPAFERH